MDVHDMVQKSRLYFPRLIPNYDLTMNISSNYDLTMNIIMNLTNILTVKQFPEKYPAFPNGAIRNLIFHGSSNGLNDSGAIIRIGRKILINEVKFFEWLNNLNDK